MDDDGVRAILERLSHVRPVFHSEADFQHALAWQFQADHEPGVRVRLETRPFPGRALDLAVTIDGVRLAIELKYLARRFTHVAGDGERFELLAQAAQDVRRYDVIKDISRVEDILAAGLAERGYVVVLTNDAGYWSTATRTTVDAAFRLHEGQELKGSLGWAADAGPGTTKGRMEPIMLRSTYDVRWVPYSRLSDAPGGDFRYAAFSVIAISSADVAMGMATPAEHGPGRDIGRPALTATSESARLPIARPGKYTPLKSYLEAGPAEPLTLTFSQIDAIVGGLPPDARASRSWWANLANTSTRSQARAWQGAGRLVEEVRLGDRVRFSARSSSRSTSPPWTGQSGLPTGGPRGGGGVAGLARLRGARDGVGLGQRPLCPASWAIAGSPM